MEKLLTRTAFREGCIIRDHGDCVLCGAPFKDVHHILERRLWSDEGYYLNNGASVCEKCHLLCESTDISVEKVREAAGILKSILPPHLYDDQVYDKWGNIILPNGQRLKGELFYDESVQKILSTKLDLFSNYVKYPRTFHFPWSPGIHNDDRVHEFITQFIGKRIIIHEKLDGENTTLYNDYIHARSVFNHPHASRTWVKNFWGSIAYNIPKGYRINVENVFAKHSISYNELDTYAYGFAVWNDKNELLSWDDCLEWFQLLDIVPCPVLYDGIWDEKIIHSFDDRDWNKHEGYVIRLAKSFPYKDFKYNVGKFVRKGHVQTTKHWMHGQAIEENKLKNE